MHRIRRTPYKNDIQSQKSSDHSMTSHNSIVTDCLFSDKTINIKRKKTKKMKYSNSKTKKHSNKITNDVEEDMYEKDEVFGSENNNSVNIHQKNIKHKCLKNQRKGNVASTETEAQRKFSEDSLKY